MLSEVAYEQIKKSQLWSMVDNSEADDLADYFGAIAELTPNKSYREAFINGLIDAEVERRLEAQEANRKYQEAYR